MKDLLNLVEYQSTGTLEEIAKFNEITALFDSFRFTKTNIRKVIEGEVKRLAILLKSGDEERVISLSERLTKAITNKVNLIDTNTHASVFKFLNTLTVNRTDDGILFISMPATDLSPSFTNAELSTAKTIDFLEGLS